MHDDDSTPLPCCAALLAGTLALMTAHARSDALCSESDTAQRRLIARKIVSNLSCMHKHPGLLPGLRQVAANMHAHWVPLAACEAVAALSTERSDASTPSLGGAPSVLLH